MSAGRSVVEAMQRVLGGDESRDAAARLEATLAREMDSDEGLDDLRYALSAYSPGSGPDFIGAEDLRRAVRAALEHLNLSTTDITAMREHLRSIEASLNALRRHDLLRLLQPPLSGEVVDARLREHQLDLSDDVRELFAWKDGTETAEVQRLDTIYLFPGFYFLSLKAALASYRALVSDRRWGHDWFPLFADGGGDFYFIDLATSARGAVRRFRLEEDHHPVEFSSLGSMVTTLAEAYDEGVIYVDDEHYLEWDRSAFTILAARHNPSVGWWTDPLT